MITQPKTLTVNDLRMAALMQEQLGLYPATEREIPPKTFVEVADRYGMKDDKPDLGVVLEIEKYREQHRHGPGRMVRKYLVLTLNNGQQLWNREDLRPLTHDEIRAYEGISAEDDFLAACVWAYEHGKSEAVYNRAVAAAQALTEPIMVVPAKCKNCPNIICSVLNARQVDVAAVLQGLQP